MRKQTLINYIGRTASERDAVRVEQWLSENPRNRRYFEELSAQLAMVSLSLSHDCDPSEEDFSVIMDKISGRRRGRRLVITISSIAVAASLLLLFLLPVSRTSEPSEEELFRTAYAEWAILDNTMGEQTVFNRLPDGTKVFISAGSQLKISPSFGRETREIALEGLAHFDVAPDASRPFVINTPEGHVIKVLGTSFIVNTGYKEKSTNVALEHGRVSVTMGQGVYKGRSFEMSPGEMTVITGGDVLLSTIPADFYEEYDITKDYFLFENTPFSEILNRLEAYFDVRFNVYCHQVLKYTYTGNFNGLTLTEILEAIKFTLNINYKVSPNEIILLK